MTSALIIIDVQKTWSDQNPLTAKRILAASKALRNTMPIIWVYMDSKAESRRVTPASPGRIHDIFNSAKESYVPTYRPFKSDFVLTKAEPNAFAGTELESFLKARDLQKLYFTGFLSSQCVFASAACGGKLGFKSHLVTDLSSDYNDTGPIFCQYPMLHTSLSRRNADGWVSLTTAKDIGLNLS